MTDNEIVKALEVCCAGACTEVCPQYSYKYHDCMEQLMNDTIDLIQRQQERIERLKDNLDAVLKERADHTEAIEEFADRIVERLERIAYETADWMCGGTMKAVELTDAIAIVKGGK